MKEMFLYAIVYKQNIRIVPVRGDAVWGKI